MSNLSIKKQPQCDCDYDCDTTIYDYIRVQVQVQLLLRLLLPTAIAISISGITRRANRYSTQIAAVYLHVADRYSTSTSGITRRANRYSTQIAAVYLHVADRNSTSSSGITRRANRYWTQIAAVLACSRPLFDKHQRYNAKSEPHDKYVNRNRHDFMFFSMMRSQHMSPDSLALGLQGIANRCCRFAESGNSVIHRHGE